MLYNIILYSLPKTSFQFLGLSDLAPGQIRLTNFNAYKGENEICTLSKLTVYWKSLKNFVLTDVSQLSSLIEFCDRAPSSKDSELNLCY